MDGWMRAVDRKFEEVDRRFDTLKYKMSQNENEASARNFGLSRLHQKIQMITVVDSTSLVKGTIKEPATFPTTIKDFWSA